MDVSGGWAEIISSSSRRAGIVGMILLVGLLAVPVDMARGHHAAGATITAVTQPTWTTTVVVPEAPGPYRILADGTGGVWSTALLWESGFHQATHISTAGAITTARVPNGASAVGPDGALWFVDPSIDRLVRLAIDGTTTVVTTLPHSYVGGMTAGPDGNLWLTVSPDQPLADASLYRVTPTGSITAFDADRSALGAITVGPDGNLWVASDWDVTKGPAMLRVTTEGVITTFPTSGGPGTLVPAPDGVWFRPEVYVPYQRIAPDGTITDVEQPDLADVRWLFPGPGSTVWLARDGELVRVGPGGVEQTISTTTIDDTLIRDPTNGAVYGAAGIAGDVWVRAQKGAVVHLTADGTATVHAAPVMRAPTRPVTGPDGNVWFGNASYADAHVVADLRGGSISRVDATGAVTSFATPGLLANRLVAAPDGNLWFTDPEAHVIGRMTTAGVLSRFEGDAIRHPTALVVGSDGQLWYTDDHWIGRLTLEGSVSTFSSSIGSPTSLALGGDGNVWFTDEATASVGRLTPDGAVTTFPVPGASMATDMVADHAGHLWWIAGGPTLLARISFDGTIAWFSASGGEGIGSLFVSPSGNIWWKAYGGSPVVLRPDGTFVEDQSEGFPGTAGPNGTTWQLEERGLAVRSSSPPSAPAVVGGNGRIAAWWSPPAIVNAGTITGYSATAFPGGASCTTTGATSCVIEGVPNDVAYLVTVTASNGLGVSRPSLPSTWAYPLRFPDVPLDAPFATDIRWLAAEGITTGNVDGTFRPNESITRQAMAAFLYRFADSPNGASPPCDAAPFTDVAVGAPFCGEIAWMRAQSITTGFPDGSFHPNDSVDRQAMAAFLYRSQEGSVVKPTCAAMPFTDVAVGSAFCGEIAWLKANGVSTGHPDGSYHPNEPVSRQAMAAFLHRLSLL